MYYVNDGDEVKIGESAGCIFKELNDAKEKLKEIKAKPKEKEINATKKAIEYAQKIGFDLSLIKKERIIKVSDIEEYIINHNIK